MRNIPEEINVYHSQSWTVFVDTKDYSRNKRLSKNITNVTKEPNKIDSIILTKETHDNRKELIALINNKRTHISLNSALSIITNSNISNGTVQSECVWAYYDGFNPVVIGGDIYNELMKKDNVLNEGTIRQSPGGIYSDLNKNKYLYFGHLPCIDITSKYVASKYSSYNPYNSGVYVYTAKPVKKHVYMPCYNDVFIGYKNNSIEGFKSKKKLFKNEGVADHITLLNEGKRWSAKETHSYYASILLINETELTDDIKKHYPGVTWAS